MNIRVTLPWYLRVIAKLALSKLPFDYSIWSRVGLFRHGAMDDFSYAWRVLQRHVSVLGEKEGWRGLELGPGDGLLSAFLAPAAGSDGLVLVDSGDFVHKDVERYKKQISKFLAAYPEARLPALANSDDVHVLLGIVGGAYYSHGLQSLAKMKSGAFDLIYSQAVLEHVRYDEFKDTMKECFRLLRPDGVMSHIVDYKDHLGGGLNNMRFSSGLWEREWFAAESGFYTNRLRMTEMISICRDIGFRVDVRSVRRWESLPIRRELLAKEFHHLSDEELLISGAHLVMYPK